MKDFNRFITVTTTTIMILPFVALVVQLLLLFNVIG